MRINSGFIWLICLGAIFIPRLVEGQDLKFVPKDTKTKPTGYVYFLHVGSSLHEIFPMCISDIPRPEFKKVVPGTPIIWFEVSKVDLNQIISKVKRYSVSVKEPKPLDDFGTFRLNLYDGKTEKESLIFRKNAILLFKIVKNISSGKYKDLETEMDDLQKRLKTKW
jgi:hypothetical protein